MPEKQEEAALDPNQDFRRNYDYREILKFWGSMYSPFREVFVQVFSKFKHFKCTQTKKLPKFLQDSENIDKKDQFELSVLQIFYPKTKIIKKHPYLIVIPQKTFISIHKVCWRLQPNNTKKCTKATRKKFHTILQRGKNNLWNPHNKNKWQMRGTCLNYYRKMKNFISVGYCWNEF